MQKTTLLKAKLKYSTRNAKRKAKSTKKGRNSIKSAR